MDPGPERDSVAIAEYFCDAGEPGGPVNNVFRNIFNYLQICHVCVMYTIELGVT